MKTSQQICVTSGIFDYTIINPHPGTTQKFDLELKNSLKKSVNYLNFILSHLEQECMLIQLLSFWILAKNIFLIAFYPGMSVLIPEPKLLTYPLYFLVVTIWFVSLTTGKMFGVLLQIL